MAKDNLTRLGNNPLFRKDVDLDTLTNPGTLKKEDVPAPEKKIEPSLQNDRTPSIKKSTSKINKPAIDINERIDQLRRYYGQPLDAEQAISQLLRRTTFSFTECGSDVCRLISDVCRDVSGKKVDNLQHSFVVNVALFLMLDIMEKDNEWYSRLKDMVLSDDTLSPEVISVYLYNALKNSL
jgi:hypothetical protein